MYVADRGNRDHVDTKSHLDSDKVPFFGAGFELPKAARPLIISMPNQWTTNFDYFLVWVSQLLLRQSNVQVWSKGPHYITPDSRRGTIGDASEHGPIRVVLIDKIAFSRHWIKNYLSAVPDNVRRAAHNLTQAGLTL
jgi:hypothetical protein